MLMQKPTQEMIEEWKIICNQHKGKIIPNKKDGIEIIKYLENNYSITELDNDELHEIVYKNITENEHLANKLKGKSPIIRMLRVNNIEKGKKLYSNQDNVFKDIEIIIGIELKTSYIFVEGSSYLYDELVAFTGLDEEDINNNFLVAQYVKCLEKFDNN